MTPPTTITVSSPDPRAAPAVTAALGLLARHLRASGRAVPPWLADAVVWPEEASSGQERPTLDGPRPSRDGPAMAPLLLDYDAAAAVLGVSSRSVRRLVARGVVPAVRIGGRSLIRPADLAAYADALPSSA